MTQTKDSLSKNNLKRLRVGLVGHSGRMGQEFVSLLSASKFFELIGVWGRDGQSLLSETAQDWSGANLDLVIDFSLPENMKAVISWTQEHQVPLISGVTGIGASFLDHFHMLGFQKVNNPIFWASNMSLGIATVRSMLKSLQVFKGSEFTIVETHHVHKKDKPSGTAVTLKNDLEEYIGKDCVRVEAIREGEVFGIHEIMMRSSSEEIVIRHKALNRKVFAEGALHIAPWLVRQPAGIYSMGDFFKYATES